MLILSMRLFSVADPHHFNADPDPDLACHFDASPDLACHFDADPDPTFHFAADPDPSVQVKGRTLEKCSNRLIFHTFWLVICKLMRIRIQFTTLIRIRIQFITLMRTQIRIKFKVGQQCFYFLPSICLLILSMPSVADPGSLSRILIFTHPGSRISDPGSKNSNKRDGWKKNLLSYLFL
jgi:hypothetical protein